MGHEIEWRFQGSNRAIIEVSFINNNSTKLPQALYASDQLLLNWVLPYFIATLMSSLDLDNIADVRDGLTRKERIVLYCLHQLQKELNGRNAPTVMLYGRVVEYIDMSEQELQFILQRLSGFNSNPID